MFFFFKKQEKKVGFNFFQFESDVVHQKKYIKHREIAAIAPL